LGSQTKAAASFAARPGRSQAEGRQKSGSVVLPLLFVIVRGRSGSL